MKSSLRIQITEFYSKTCTDCQQQLDSGSKKIIFSWDGVLYKTCLRCFFPDGLADSDESLMIIQDYSPGVLSYKGSTTNMKFL